MRRRGQKRLTWPRIVTPSARGAPSSDGYARDRLSITDHDASRSPARRRECSGMA